ncbi:putative ABC transporter, permease associated with salivaricin lantibiotic [Leuconostoc litchii]|nr:FtsX-like permease family protein [Leuconostoc litchii]GMA69791.1 putative ABC transporter, permease associated with salivaricin lantibiotic [Leuconostoc litchii]
MLQFFGNDQLIIKRLAEDANIQSMANVVSAFYIIFIIFYFVYFNNFFVKQRIEELGIYTILGFRKSKIISIVSLENILLSFVSFCLSVPIGLISYIAIRTMLIKFIKLNINIYHMTFSSHVVSKILILFVVVSAIIFFEVCILFRGSLVKLLQVKVQQDKKIRKHPLGATIGFTFIILSYALILNLFTRPNSIWDDVGFYPVMLVTIALIVFGTVMVINFTLPMVLDLQIKHKNLLYRKINNVVLPRMIHQVRQRGKLLTTISLLIAATILVLGITIMTLSYPFEATKRIVPSSVETVITKKNVLNKKQVDNIKSRYHAQVTHSIVLREKIGKPLQVDAKRSFNYIDIISSSNYNRILKEQNRPLLKKVQKDKAVMVNYYTKSGEEKEKTTIELSNLHQKLMINQTTNNNPFAFVNSVTTVVVSDEYFSQIVDVSRNKYSVYSINSKKLRNNKSLVSYIDNLHVDMISSYKKNQEITHANSPTFLMITLIAILLFISVTTVLYFTSRIEQLKVAAEYKTAHSIGYSLDQILMVMKKEIGILFFPPLLIGFLDGVIGIIGFRYIIADAKSSNNWIMLGKPLLLVTVIFIPIYVLVYYYSYRGTFNELHKKIVQ